MPAPTLFTVFATDRVGRAAVRAATREVHRAYLRQVHEAGLVVVTAGPTLGEDGEMNGTMLVVEAASLVAVQRFVAADPYSQNDLFASVEIRGWRCGLVRPELLNPGAPAPSTGLDLRP